VRGAVADAQAFYLTPVWAGGNLVAKLHADPDHARREQLLAYRLQASGNRAAAPLGVSIPPTDTGMVSWWFRLPLDGPARSPGQQCRRRGSAGH
jgi:hypothetical protein